MDPGSGLMDPVDDIDECALNSSLCGFEAGCWNTPGSYICLCHMDLMPPGENNSCDRKHESNTTSIPNSTTEKHPHAPTESSFGSRQLEKMLSPRKISPGNGTDGNSSQYQNTTTYSLQSTETSDTQSTVLLACLFAVALVTVLSVATCIWRRRRRFLPPWIPFCFSRERPHLTSAAALGKCMQQYVTNPNYYSNSPDAPLLKTLRDMEIPHENITFVEEIGEGCFGKVHKGIYSPSPGVAIPMAVKILKDGTSPETQADIEREVEIMSAFNHENILKLIGVVMKDTGSTPWMVFEYMQFGDLAELLRNNSPRLRSSPNELPFVLTQPDLVWIATQIASGMVYLSSQHFVHRDLATRNCLVGENLTVKISDFGMSRDIYTSDYYKIGGSRMLPIRWMAPESITYGKFSLESDVWSYGVVLWEIFTFGKQPYYGHSNDEVVKLILQGILLSPPENCPTFVYSIMAGCWKTDPRNRLNFPEIFNLLVANSPNRGSQSYSSVQDDPEILLDSDNYLIPNAITVV